MIDLMGFTVAGPGHFYASGHPGPGTDLPNPVGLIESTDGGQTWTPLSRQGRSDFHTLTASTAGIVGFDGDELATTADGRTWQPLTPPVAPHATAAAPDGSTLLVTSPQGLVRSVDRGRTWARVTTAVPLQLAAFADATHVVAAAPDGRIATSADAGATWETAGSIGGTPHALGAQRTPTGTEILAVTSAGLLRSVDDAAFTTYQPLPPAGPGRKTLCRTLHCRSDVPIGRRWGATCARASVWGERSVSIVGRHGPGDGSRRTDRPRRGQLRR